MPKCRSSRASESWITPSGGSRFRGAVPGLAASLDIELYQKRRAAMLALLKTGAGVSPYAAWLPISEALSRNRSEKLELYLKLLYDLLRDLIVLGEGGTRNSQPRSAERSDCAVAEDLAPVDHPGGQERGRNRVTAAAQHSEDDRARWPADGSAVGGAIEGPFRVIDAGRPVI